MPFRTIRKATPADFPEIKRLLREHRIDFVPSLATLARSHLLVLAAPDGNGLSAVALLALEHGEGRVPLLAIDRRYEHLGIEERILGVCESLCLAYGATSLKAPRHLAA